MNEALHKKEQDFRKIIILGDENAKISLRPKIDNTYEPDYKSIIGVQFFTKVLENERYIVKLVLWDVKFESKFASYRHLYYKDADGAIAYYDVTNLKSFQNLVSELEKFLNQTQKNTKVILIGMVSNEDKRVISKAEGNLLKNKFYSILAFKELRSGQIDQVEALVTLLTEEILKGKKEIQ